MTTVTTSPATSPATTSTRFHLVAPFASDARKWDKLPWANLYAEAGQRYTICARPSLYALPREVWVKTYHDVLAEYLRHPETKSLAPDGAPCTGATVGLLRRRPVAALYLTHIGRESNQLEEVEAGLVHDPDDVYTEYQDPEHDAWRTFVVPVLQRMPARHIREQTGMSLSQIKAIRNEHALPRPQHRERLTRVAGDFAREQLRAAGQPVPRSDLEACAVFLALSQDAAADR